MWVWAFEKVCIAGMRVTVSTFLKPHAAADESILK